MIQSGRPYATAKMSDTIFEEDVIIPEDVRAAWSDVHAKPG